jgi:uncharacterized protein (UPF0262 family)
MTARLSQIDVADSTGFAPPADIEQERRVAIFDLLEENRFALAEGPEGPYRLMLAAESGKLRFVLSTETGAPAAEFSVSLAPLRQVVKDYGQICSSYYDAVRTKGPGEIEALDEARRAIHQEGGRLLRERLEARAELDDATARRLFTLLCAMTPAA